MHKVPCVCMLGIGGAGQLMSIYFWQHDSLFLLFPFPFWHLFLWPYFVCSHDPHLVRRGISSSTCILHLFISSHLIPNAWAACGVYCGVVNREKLKKDKKRTRWNEGGVKENEWATDGMKIADQNLPIGGNYLVLIHNSTFFLRHSDTKSVSLSSFLFIVYFLYYMDGSTYQSTPIESLSLLS